MDVYLFLYIPFYRLSANNPYNPFVVASKFNSEPIIIHPPHQFSLCHYYITLFYTREIGIGVRISVCCSVVLQGISFLLLLLLLVVIGEQQIRTLKGDLCFLVDFLTHLHRTFSHTSRFESVLRLRFDGYSSNTLNTHTQPLPIYRSNDSNRLPISPPSKSPTNTSARMQEDAVGSVREPTPGAELTPKTMKVSDLRDELAARNLSPKGELYQFSNKWVRFASVSCTVNVFTLIQINVLDSNKSAQDIWAKLLFLEQVTFYCLIIRVILRVFPDL